MNPSYLISFILYLISIILTIGLIVLSIFVMILMIKVLKRGIKALDIYIDKNKNISNNDSSIYNNTINNDRNEIF